MRKINRLVFLGLALASACASREESARALYNQSLEAQRQGRLDEYEDLLRKVASKYPSTAVATDANRDLSALESYRKAAEEEAQTVLRLINIDQILYLSVSGGQYAKTFDDLERAEKNLGELLRPERGYKYELHTTKDGYTVTATPAKLPLKKHFFTDISATLREETDKPATATSPEVKSK